MAGFPLEVQRGLRLALDAERQGLLSPERLDAILRYYDQEGGIYPAPAPEVLEKLGGLTAAQVAHLLGLRPPGFQPRELTPRLLLLEPLGEGGMGTVYKAQDRVLRRVVAVKLIKGERLGSSQALQRFEREALVMARVAHPACVPVYEAGVAGDQPYLVMKLIPGRSLKDVLIQHPLGVDPRRVARWGQRLAEGLQACHEAGVIHRDVKPANVLLDEQDQPLLTDFGVALDGEARTRLTLASGAVGTLAYMPPEQAGGEIADPRSDLYALGATLYEALTGRLPLEADQPLVLIRKIAEERPCPLREHRAELPVDLERVVLTCLEKAKEDRYTSAQALALDLARFLAGEPVSARPVGPLGRIWRGALRYRVALSGIALAVFLGTMVTTLTGMRSRRRAREAGLSEIARLIEVAGRASEERLVQLAGSADSHVANRADAALRALRARNYLGQAREALDEIQALAEREASIQVRLLALANLIDEAQAVSASVLKQERLRLRDEREQLPVLRAQAMVAVLKGLDSAGRSGAESVEVEAIHARLLHELARSTQDLEEAELLQRRALLADRAGGGRLGQLLAPARLILSSETPLPVVVSRYELEKSECVMRAVPAACAVLPTEFSLPTGWYLVAVDCPGSLPFRETVCLSRGATVSLHVRRAPARCFGPLATEVVWVPDGAAHAANRELGYVAGFGVARTEVSVELWRSLWLAEGRHRELLPAELPREEATKVLSGAVWNRYPVFGVSHLDSRRFCEWLELELGLAGLQLRVDLPTLAEFHRAVRGTYQWKFPWGQHWDPAFCACQPSTGGRHQPAGMPTTDCSPYGVLGLAGGVAEWGSVAPSGQCYQFGGSWSLPATFVQGAMDGFGEFRAEWEGADAGLRYVLRPALWPRDVPRPDPSVNWIQVALRAMAAKDVGPALQAARNHVAVKPREAWRWVDRARVQLQIGDTWGAWFSATQATLLKPEWGEAWHVLGQVQLVRENKAEAVKACDRCVERDPDYRLAYYTRGAARSYLKDVVGGVADATVFLGRSERELPPEHSEVQLGREAVVGLMQRLAREAAVGAVSR